MPGSGMVEWEWGGMSSLGRLFLVLFLGVFIVGLVLVVRRLRDPGRSWSGAGPGGAPREGDPELTLCAGEIGNEASERMPQDCTWSDRGLALRGGDQNG
jgi:hypothetical protein